MFHSILTHFFYNRVFHLLASNNSSGETNFRANVAFIFNNTPDRSSSEGVVQVSKIPGNDHLNAINSSNSNMKGVFRIICRYTPCWR
jgi:hypothetical protein